MTESEIKKSAKISPKSAKISPKAHEWIMNIKGEDTVARVVDRLVKFLESKRVKVPENAEEILVKCDKCHKIYKSYSIWQKGYNIEIPRVDDIKALMDIRIPHNEYNKPFKTQEEKECNGNIILYSFPIIEKTVTITKNDVLMTLTNLDGDVIAIAEIPDEDAKNPRVGILKESYNGKFAFRIISIIDAYKLLEFWAKYNKPGPITHVVEQLIDIELIANEYRQLKKEILLQIKNIHYEHDTIMPEGIFKLMCLYIPSNCWALAQTSLDGKKASIGNGFFKNAVIDLAKGEIKHMEAFTRYRGIQIYKEK